MTLATALPPAPSRTVRRGWRPRSEADFPTLGWGVLAWAYAHLPSPADERAPFTYTDEQAQRVLRMYELDPVTGARLYRRVHVEDAKGRGKSPVAASVALAEFRGPVCFDGWDADGQPVGAPWGSVGRPAPWVQIAAVSEDQTQNTYGALYQFLTAADHRAAIDLRVDEGRTRLYLRDMPSAFLERVTASAGSREGQRLTHAVLDEPQLWTPSNLGDALARTILRNLAKTGGWAHLTGNAPVMGRGSVAEALGEPAEGALHLARRPSQVPQEDWTDDRLRDSLAETYGDAAWIDQDRILAEVRDPAHPWGEKLRFFFNVRVDGAAGASWLPEGAWDACAGDVRVDAAEPAYAVVRVSHDLRAAAVAVAQHLGDAVHLSVATFPEEPLPEGDVLDLDAIEQHLRDMHGRYPARVLDAGAPGRAVARAGPEVSYSAPFFEGSAQRLRALGMATLAAPDSAIRRAPAAQMLLSMLLDGKVTHDGGAEAAAQVAGLAGETVDAGQRVTGPVAGLAAMSAVHRAMTAPRPAPRAPGVFRSW